MNVKAMAITPDGRHAISAWYKTLKVWDLETGSELATLTGHTDHVIAVAVTPDQRCAVSASGKMLRVWDLATGSELATLTGHTSSVSALAVTPDGRYAVSCPHDKELRVWDLATGSELAAFADGGSLKACTVCPADSTIVAGGVTGRVHFLRLENVAPGPLIVTAWRRRESHRLAFGCLHCRTWSEVPVTALGTELDCPNCGQPVRLNPFVIEADWRQVAEAWQGVRRP